MLSRLIPLCLLLFACFTYSFGQDLKPECQSIDVIGPAGIVPPGEKFSFAGRIDGNVPKDVSYQWEISNGKVIEGQGTLEILVGVDVQDLHKPIIATLTVFGLSEGCARSNSYRYTIGCILPTPVLIDEFGRLAKTAFRKRLNKFFAELNNHPNNQGYIILYGTAKEMAVRERLIVNTVKLRNFDRSRITMVRGGLHPVGTAYTKPYRVPPGADTPAP